MNGVTVNVGIRVGTSVGGTPGEGRNGTVVGTGTDVTTSTCMEQAVRLRMSKQNKNLYRIFGSLAL
jgi:hypothetical protein